MLLRGHCQGLFEKEVHEVCACYGKDEGVVSSRWEGPGKRGFFFL